MIVIPRQDPIGLEMSDDFYIVLSQDSPGETEVIYIGAEHVPALCRALTELAEKAIRLQAAAVPHPSEVDE